MSFPSGSVRLQKDLLPSPNDARQRAPSPGEGLRGQLEEMTRQMQCQLQQIQSEMSNSFQEAVQVMLETTETFETLVKVQSGSQGEECEMPKAPHPKDVPEDFPEVQDEPQANRIPPDRMKPEKDKDQANHPWTKSIPNTERSAIRRSVSPHWPKSHRAENGASKPSMVGVFGVVVVVARRTKSDLPDRIRSALCLRNTGTINYIYTYIHNYTISI